MKKLTLFLCLWMVSCQVSRLDAQISSLEFDRQGKLSASGFTTNMQNVKIPGDVPFFSVLIDSLPFRSNASRTTFSGDTLRFNIRDSISGMLLKDISCKRGLKYLLRFTNTGKGDHKMENLVQIGRAHV